MYFERKNHYIFKKCSTCINKMLHVYTENVQRVLKKLDMYLKTKKRKTNEKHIETKRQPV